MVALRDGRKLIGVLRSWDQFGMANARDTHIMDARLMQRRYRQLGASGYC